MPKLENWSVGLNRKEYDAPELAKPALQGEVTGHHRKPDGRLVLTSPIVGIEGEMVRTESGTLYELGEVDPNYEAAYPNARKRLFESYGVVNV